LSLEHGGAAYAEFLATELVPAIDARYRTLTDAASRAIVGTSLGATNALHVAVTFSKTFGRMLGLSMVFEGGPPAGRPVAPGVRLYFDYGTEGIEAGLESGHRALGDWLRGQGRREGIDFRLVRIIGGRHDEASWRLRLGDGLRFLAV